MNRTARLAGLVYLVTVVTGLFGLMYVPSLIGVPGDLNATIANIVAHPMLYRLGIVAGLICYTVFLVVPLLLYRLLGPVHRAAAVAMVAFAVPGVPIAMLAIACKLDILSLLDHVPPTAHDQIQMQVRSLMDAYRDRMLIGDIFSGLWLIPFGYLVLRSGFLPRTLGILLIIGGCGYLTTVFGQILVPGYYSLAISDYDTVPAGLGEIGICLWLLIVGVGANKADSA